MSEGCNDEKILVLLFVIILAAPVMALALEPGEILVLANSSARHSVDLAKYYMEKRGIPEKKLLKLRITDKETCSRKTYDEDVVPEVREYLKK